MSPDSAATAAAHDGSKIPTTPPVRQPPTENLGVLPANHTYGKLKMATAIEISLPAPAPQVVPITKRVVTISVDGTAGAPVEITIETPSVTTPAVTLSARVQAALVDVPSVGKPSLACVSPEVTGESIHQAVAADPAGFAFKLVEVA